MATRTARAQTAGRPTSAEDATGAFGTLTAAVMRVMPSDLDGAGEAMAGAVRTVSASVASAPDENVLMGASLAAGLAIGLLVGGAPRLLAAGAVVTSVALGAALLERRPGRSRGRLATPAI